MFTVADVSWLKEAVNTIERDGYPKVSQMLLEEIYKLERQPPKKVAMFRGKPFVHNQDMTLESNKDRHPHNGCH